MTARLTATVALPADAFTVVLPSPEMISQINVEHVLGIPVRRYLELLREPDCTVKVTPLGKLRLVDRDEFRKWLEARPARRVEEKRGTAAPRSAVGDDGEFMTVEEQQRFGIRLESSTASKRQ